MPTGGPGPESAARVPLVERRLPLLPWAMGAIATIPTLAALALILHRFFQIDEFVFVRSAWLVGEGLVPYRDFFEHHTPLAYLLLAPVVAVAPETSGALVWARLACLPVAAMLVLGVYRLSRFVAGPFESAVAALALAAMPAFVSRAIEVRPDLLAATAFVWAAVLLAGARPGDLRRPFAAGLLLAVALLATQKAAHYLWGLPLATLLLPRLEGSGERRRWLAAASPLAALAASGLAFVVGLAALGAWPAFYNQNIELALRWQEGGGRFAAAGYLLPALTGAPVWSALVLFGVVALAGGAMRRAGTPARPTLILGAAAVPAALSLATLPNPWPYNFLPVFAAWTPIAALGAGTLAGRFARAATARAVLVGAALLAVALEASWWLRERARDNGLQRALVDRTLALTARDQPVFDGNGGYLFRPSAYFLWYHSAAMRAMLRRQLEAEIVPALLASGAPLFLEDPRFEELPASVRAWVRSHFQRYFGPIHLWGNALEPPPGASSGSYETAFLAIRRGHYFVTYPGADGDAGIRVRVGERDFPARVPIELAAGEHVVRVERKDPAMPVWLLWRPASGELWYPGSAPEIPLYPHFF